MADTNSRITIRMEDATPPVPGAPPVPPTEGVVAPPDLSGGTPASSASYSTPGPGGSPPDVVPPAPPAEGVAPPPGPGVQVPSMGMPEGREEEDAEDGEDSVAEEAGIFGAVVSPLRATLVVAVVAIETLTEAVQALDGSFQEMAERGGEYDAGIAQANAVADLRLTLAEMRRANVLSEELSEYMDERSNLGVEIQDAITELSRAVIPAATEVAKELRPLARGVGKLFRLFNDSGATLSSINTTLGKLAASAAFNPVIAANVAAMVTLLQLIDDHVKDPPKDDFSNFTSDLRDFLNPVTSRVNGAAEARAARDLPNPDAVFPAFRP